MERKAQVHSIGHLASFSSSRFCPRAVQNDWSEEKAVVGIKGARNEVGQMQNSGRMSNIQQEAKEQNQTDRIFQCDDQTHVTLVCLSIAVDSFLPYPAGWNISIFRCARSDNGPHPAVSLIDQTRTRTQTHRQNGQASKITCPKKRRQNDNNNKKKNIFFCILTPVLTRESMTRS